jgi:predicted transcriptional regulator
MPRDSATAPQFLPSQQDILSWEREIQSIEAAIAVLSEKKSAFLSMVSGAKALRSAVKAVVLPNGSEASQIPAKRRGRPPGKKSGKAITWTGALLSIIRSHPTGISFSNLRSEFQSSEFAGKLGDSEKSFYGAITKLYDKGLVSKYKGYLFTSDHLKTFNENVSLGLAQDLIEVNSNGQKSPFGDAIKAFLDSRPSVGATSSELVSELKKTPEFLDTMERHKSHIYNVLSRLVHQGEIVKGGGRYFRAPGRSTSTATH